MKNFFFKLLFSTRFFIGIGSVLLLLFVDVAIDVVIDVVVVIIDVVIDVIDVVVVNIICRCCY